MSERPPISPRSPRAALEPEQVPPPPKRSDRARNPFVIVGNAIFTILIILMIGAGATYYYGKQTLEAPGPLQEDKIVNIPARAGKRDIADVLSREGVINVNPWIFIGSVFALKASSDLKPGEYSFQKNASLRDVIATIVDGKVVQHAITIPEGLTSEQIVSRLSDNDIFTGSVREIPREGTLLPETYKFPRGTTRDQVIQRLQQAQKRVLAEIWERRNTDTPLKSPDQLVTLASIVEKETGRADDPAHRAAEIGLGGEVADQSEGQQDQKADMDAAHHLARQIVEGRDIELEHCEGETDGVSQMPPGARTKSFREAMLEIVEFNLDGLLARNLLLH